MKMNKEEQRIFSLDVLRVILAMMVIVLHINNSAGGKALSMSATNKGVHEFLLAIEAFSICAVNCFVLISGYFLSNTQKRKLKKPIMLLGTVVCYHLLFYGCEMLLSREFSLTVLIKNSLPINYYVWLYGTLYFISPYINVCLNQLSQKKFELLCLILFALFILWPTVVGLYTGITGTVIQQISTISSVDHGSGYTIVQFVVMYILGAYIRRFPPNYGAKTWCVLYALSSLIVYGLLHLTMAAIEYSNCFVVMSAVSLVISFTKIKRVRGALIIQKLASVSFNVFLVHGFLMPLLQLFPFAEVIKEGSLICAVMSFGFSLLLLYLLSVTISVVTRKVMKPITNLVSRVLLCEYEV